MGRKDHVRTNTIHDIDTLASPKLPRSCCEGIRFAGQGPHWAQINNVPAQLRLEHLLHVCSNLVSFRMWPRVINRQTEGWLRNIQHAESRNREIYTGVARIKKLKLLLGKSIVSWKHPARYVKFQILYKSWSRTSMVPPLPLVPRSSTPATSLPNLTQRVQWIQRVMIVFTRGPIFLLETALKMGGFKVVSSLSSIIQSYGKDLYVTTWLVISYTVS